MKLIDLNLKKMLVVVAAIVVVMTAAIPTFADQAAWVSRAEAERALKLLMTQQVIKHYCAPCGDKTVREETIQSIGLFKVESENYWEIRVNGKGVDLAYVYYAKKANKWMNVAMQAKISVRDVPKVLDSSRIK